MAAAAAVVLLLCTYLTLSPGSLFLPGLAFDVCAADGPGAGLRAGSALVVRLGAAPHAGALAVWQDAGEWKAGRVAEVQDGLAVMDGGESVAVQELAGNAEYEIFALGACIGALSGQPGRYLVWAADGLYVFGWCVWGLTLPGRRRRRRKAELIRLFEQYGAQYDLEEEGVEY